MLEKWKAMLCTYVRHQPSWTGLLLCTYTIQFCTRSMMLHCCFNVVMPRTLYRFPFAKSFWHEESFQQYIRDSQAPLLQQNLQSSTDFSKITYRVMQIETRVFLPTSIQYSGSSILASNCEQGTHAKLFSGHEAHPPTTWHPLLLYIQNSNALHCFKFASPSPTINL